MWISETQKRIIYGETDMMGYLYYGHYAKLYEIGRVEAIRSLGITYKELEEVYRIMMPVIYVESRYLGPVTYDELITIRTIVKTLPTKLIAFFHEILNEEGKMVHTATVKLFFVDMKTNKRISAPDVFTESIKKYFE